MCSLKLQRMYYIHNQEIFPCDLEKNVLLFLLDTVFCMYLSDLVSVLC